jgi:hypothetical protein
MMAAEYQLQQFGVIRIADRACIPNDPANMDWVKYQEWLTAGGVPDAMTPLAPQTPVASQTQLLAVAFNHENRLRVVEGQPPLTLGAFLSNVYNNGY